jgi:hypothetical protein
MAIIIELNGSGARYNYDESLIHDNLINNGFNSYTYNPIKRELCKIKSFGLHPNTIYIRDIEFVVERLKEADKVDIRGKLI